MIKISKNQLKYLYSIKKLNSREIAEIYKCNKNTVLRKLNQYNIRTRPSGSKIKITKKQLKDLYLKRKYSTWKIAEIIGYPRSTVYRYLKKYKIKLRDISESHIKYKRRHFDGNVVEKAYIIGFALGDMRVRKVGKRSRTIKTDCGSTKIEQIKLIQELFGKYGHIWTKKYKNKIQIEVFLDESFSFLLNPIKELDKIFNKKEEFISFLSGFIDAEGSIFISKNKPYFSLGNYDFELLHKIKDKLMDFDIETNSITKDNKLRASFGVYKRKNYYFQLRISRRKTLLSFLRMIKPHIRHEKRLSDINKALNILNDKN